MTRIESLNAICVGLGGTNGHATELAAWQAIEVQMNLIVGVLNGISGGTAETYQAAMAELVITQGGTGYGDILTLCNELATIIGANTQLNILAAINAIITELEGTVQTNILAAYAELGTLLIDETAPVVTAFVIPETSVTLTIPITTFTATDDVEVTGYMLTETDVAPSADDEGWEATAPETFTFSAEGEKTLYAWAKDEAGNVSNSLSDSVVVAFAIYSGTSGAVNLAIPNNSNDGITSTIELSDDTELVLTNSDIIEVTLNINHTYSGDVIAFLVDPSGTRAMLLTKNHGGSADNYTNTVLRTDVLTTLSSGTAPFTGTFKPDGGIDIAPNLTGAAPNAAGSYEGIIPSDSLLGASIDGTWTLRVFDYYNRFTSVANNIGTLANWSLSITKVLP